MYQSSNSFGPVGYTGFNTPAGGGAMNGTNGGTARQRAQYQRANRR